MAEQENEKKTEEQKSQEPVKEQAEYTPSLQPDFLRETIKQKPVNKKKLLRRTLITVVMAVVFGLVACVTFLVLEPVISNRLYPEEEAEEVQFPEETVSEEMKPEDMLIEDNDVEEEEAPAEPVQVELEDEQIDELLSRVEFTLSDYETLYGELSDLAHTASRFVVTVTGVTSDVDWFNDIYENEASASGVIIADNGKSILILVSEDALSNAESIVVTFCDQTQMQAELIQRDQTTGLAILAVPLSAIGKETMNAIDIAILGSSNVSSLTGTPVIAIGSPLGTSGSVCYGMITSMGTVADYPDCAYKIITTDIYGSPNATGVLIDLKGRVIGIVDHANRKNNAGNLLTVYGISELKWMIEQMSNDKERPYLGVHGADVPKEALEELGIIGGAYIREIEIDSPAMNAGIQSGDVITKIGDTEITTYNRLLHVLHNVKPDDVITVTLLRQGREMQVEVTFGRIMYE